ncbi:MAG: 50S ribosomal protein L29 [Terriglobales bacterium]
MVAKTKTARTKTATAEAPPKTMAVLRHENRQAEKIRNLSDAELKQQERELNDQLFRLKFQLKMGQTESLKKIRGLRKDLARVKTMARARVLGIEAAAGERR